MRHDLRNIKKNATWLMDYPSGAVKLNKPWRDVICKLCDEVDQLETELAKEESSHNFALALMQKAIDAADQYLAEKDALEFQIDEAVHSLNRARTALLIRDDSDDG